MTPPPRAPAWALAAGVAVFQVVGSFGATDNQPERRAMDAVAVALVLVGPAALAMRRRRPLAAAAAAIAAAVVSIGLGYALGPIFVSPMVALFHAVVAGHRRPAWALAAAGYVGFVVALVVDPDEAGRGEGPLHIALVAAWLAVVLAVAEVVRTRRLQAESRERDEEQARQQRLGAQRLGLAQELHDVLAHNISLINVQASVALHLLDEHPERAGPALATIKATSSDALVELRTALDILRDGDAPRAPAPRLADLDALVDGVRAGGLAVELRNDLAATTVLPAAVELAAFRIVQEALTNVTRHARARSVTVRVGFTDGHGDGDGDGDAVTLAVTDDGIGAISSAPTVPGNGIVGMQERAAALGGTVEARPVDGGGFRVAAHLPVRR